MVVQCRVLRQWLLQQAYFDKSPDGPSWAVPGNVIGERAYPLSTDNRWVNAVHGTRRLRSPVPTLMRRITISGFRPGPR